MIGSIVTIVLGVVIWQMVPGWIETGNSSVRQTIRLVCNIVGIIMILFGAYDLIMSIVR